MFERLADDKRVGRDVLSPSAISKMYQSPKHFHAHYILGEKKEPTKAMLEGTMIHMAVLEPEKFLETYSMLDSDEGYLKTIADISVAIQAEGEKPVKGTKSDLIAQLKGINPAAKIWDCYLRTVAQSGKELLKSDQFKDCVRVMEEVKNHKWLTQALSGGMAEQPAWWEHSSGALISMRLDYYHPGMGGNVKRPVIIDLKKARDASPQAFSRVIYNNQLYIQAAMYVDGVTKITGQEPVYCWAVVEDKSPYVVECYAADFGTLEMGRNVYNKMIERYYQCKEAVHWPAYTEGRVTNISVPAWAFNRMDEFTGEEEI